MNEQTAMPKALGYLTRRPPETGGEVLVSPAELPKYYKYPL
jgi:hypothetical protein